MRLDRAQRGPEIVVDAVTPFGVDLLARPLAGNEAIGGKPLPRSLPRRRVVADPLGDDVARAGQRGVDIGHTVGEVRFGRDGGIELAILRQQCQRQRFEPALARDLGARLAFGFVRAIEILHRLEGRRGVELGRQLVGQLLLRGNLGLDRIAALGQLAQVFQPGLDVPDLHFVQPARDLFAVARDERDRVAVVQEGDGGGDLVQRDGQFFGDKGSNGWCRQKGTSVGRITDGDYTSGCRSRKKSAKG